MKSPTLQKPATLREAGAEQALAARLGGRIAFLRHRLPDFEHRESSDWDVAVQDAGEAGAVLEEWFGRPLVFVPKRFVIQRFFEWGQIDLLPVFEWQGLEYLKPDLFWDGVNVGEDGLPRPRLAHDAFIVWMTGLLWGARYNPRYDGLIRRAAAEDGEAFSRCAADAFGKRLGGELFGFAECGEPQRAVPLVRSLRRALWRRRFAEDAVGTARRQVLHWRTELEHHVRPPFPWIAFLGPDGSGKSTVIEGFLARLGPSRLKVMQAHWGPEPRGENEAPGPPVTDPHGRKPRGAAFSIAKTAWLCLRWWRARLGRVGHGRSKRALFLSDRYFDDLLVDPRRYRYGASLRWARAMFRLLPRPDVVVVLAGDPATIHRRKGETTFEELDRQTDAYRALAGEIGNRAVLVDAALTPEEVAERVWHAVWGEG